jgi:hypothetical protein
MEVKYWGAWTKQMLAWVIKLVNQQSVTETDVENSCMKPDLVSE